IFGREDVVALQVIGGINVLGFFLLTFFAGAFLTGGFRNALIFLVLGLVLSLILSVAWGSAEDRKGKNQKRGHTKTHRAGRGLYGSQAADPGWCVAIRTCHSKPTTDGGQRLKGVYPRRPFLGYNNFFRGLPS